MTPDPNVLLRIEPCTECGAMVLWTQNAWAHGDSRAAAYQCLNGHVVDPHTTHQCPKCGLHDTHPITSPEDGAFACNRCGNRFEVGS